jgi:RNA polymerase sigma-70 factor (ECF subfamily)
MGDRETELMGRYCDGDVRAFHELYALVAPRLLRYLAGLCGDRATAEDLLQQSFLKVHRARPSYVRGAELMPWIYTIAHRTCLDELRRRKGARMRPFRESEASLDAAAAAPQPPEGDEGRSTAERVQAIGAALARLPANQREAVRLTKLEGHSVAQAAALTGTSPGAIKLRVHRAYANLRKLLRDRVEAPA